MRLYNRTEFPAGTLFVQGQRDYFYSGLSVKGDTIVQDGENIDWWSRSVSQIYADSSNDRSERLAAMKKHGAAFPVDTMYTRDGSFDFDEIFLVYELEDLNELACVVEAANNAGSMELRPWDDSGYQDD